MRCINKAAGTVVSITATIARACGNVANDLSGAISRPTKADVATIRELELIISA